MDAAGDNGKRCFLRPDPEKCTNMSRFRDRVNEKYGLSLSTYKELYDWTLENYPEFWSEVWDFTDIKCSRTCDKVVDRSVNIADIPKWFEGSRLNYAENLLKYNDDRIAIYACVEGTTHYKTKTYAELRKSVAIYAEAMRKMGIKKNDRVVGYISNCIEAVEAMLAAASLGAIWSSTSPDFGVTGVLERFTQIQPRLIFSVNAVVYNGKVHDHMEKLEKVVKGLPDIEKVVIIPYVVKVGDSVNLGAIPNSCFLEEFLKEGYSSDGGVPELVFEQVPFDHPLFIMYSSGTTGVPKCMVHSVGGTLIKHLEEHVLQGNMTRDDIMLYYTTTGWMMWNWLVGALAAGAAILCYDGSPLIPSPSILWDLVDKIGITALGTGAKWLAVLEEKNVKPRETHSLKSLHSILSTGSPLKPQSFDYVYRDIKPDVLLGSITGGTDIISCFAGQSWMLPVIRGEIQGRLLGMAMESWNENGEAVYGEAGELVCTKPFPSMPTHFWKDDTGAKYKKAYFNKFPGVWAHGDYCLINPETGGIWMLGRSDGTLNPNGVRFGSAEIYQIVEAFKEIADSLCVSQQKSDLSEERVILFLKMAEDCQFNEDLVKRLRIDIRMQLSARHVPSIIMETKDIPYTISGKKVEVAVKQTIAGNEVKARGAYANPDSLDLYKDIPELQDY